MTHSRLPKEFEALTIGEMPVDDVGYVEASDIWVDKDRRMWIDCSSVVKAEKGLFCSVRVKKDRDEVLVDVETLKETGHKFSLQKKRGLGDSLPVSLVMGSLS